MFVSFRTLQMSINLQWTCLENGKEKCDFLKSHYLGLWTVLIKMRGNLQGRRLDISSVFISAPWIYGISTLWKILQEMGIPDHLTCLLRNLYAGQEATVRSGHGTTDWFQIGKGVCKGCILSPCLFNLYAEYIMRNTGLEEVQAGEMSITLDMQKTPPLWQKVKRN